MTRRKPVRRRPVKRNRTVKRGKTISLRNFTGRVRLNPDKTVSVIGVGRKKKKAKRK